MRLKLAAISLLFICLLASCAKDAGEEGYITVYNDFLIFGKTTKTSDKGFYVITTDNTYTNKRWAVKITSEGQKQWKSFLGYSTVSETDQTPLNIYVGLCEIPEDKGCLVLIDSTLRFTSDSAVSYLKFIRLGADGSHLWTKDVLNPFYQPRGEVRLSAVYVTEQNEVVVQGLMSNKEFKGFGVAKYSLSGAGLSDNATWAKQYYISGYTTLPLSDDIHLERVRGGYVLLAPFNDNDQKGVVLKISDNGDELWRFYNRSNRNSTYLADLAETNDGKLIIVGRCGRFNVGTQDDYYIMGLSSGSGDLLWENQMDDDSSQANVARAITPMSNGNYLIIGDKSDYTAEGKIDSHTQGTDLFIIEIDANGNEVRRSMYNTAFGIHGNDIQENFDGSYLILGSKHSFGYHEFRDLTVMKMFPGGKFTR